MTLPFLKYRYKIESSILSNLSSIDIKVGLYGGGVSLAPSYVYILDMETAVPKGVGKRGRKT